jgi:hypothetical protein
VDDEIGDDGVEGPIGKRKLADVAVAHFDAVRDTFGSGVGERRGGGVAAWARCDQMSTPTARPDGTRCAAPIRSNP